MTAEVCVFAERSAERAAQSEPMVSNSYTVMPLEAERLLERAHRVQGSRTLECTSTLNTRQCYGHPFQTELLMNNHVVLLDIRRQVFAGQEGINDRRQPVSTTSFLLTAKY